MPDVAELNAVRLLLDPVVDEAKREPVIELRLVPVAACLLLSEV